MIFVANYVMKGQIQALLATFIISVLTVWLAPFGLLIGAIIALVTLRVGITEGVKVFALAAVTSVALASLVTGSMLPGLVSMIEYMLPVLVAALVLRSTNQLSSALTSLMVMAGSSVIAFHLVVGDTTQWWSTLYTEKLLPVLQQSGMDTSDFILDDMFGMLTMILGITIVILWFTMLLIGRYWQSAMYYEGRFQSDFYQLRLSKEVVIVSIVVILLGLVWQDNNLFKDLAGVLMAGLMFQGLAIAHHSVNTKDMSKAWLTGLYFLLFIFPQTLLMLATLAIVDFFMNFRERWKND